MEHYDGPVFLRRQQHKPVAKPTPARRQVVPEAPAPVPTATATPKRRPQQPVAAKRPSVNSTHRFTPKYIPQSQQHQQHSDEQVRLARYVQALNKTNDSVLCSVQQQMNQQLRLKKPQLSCPITRQQLVRQR
ncbi:hypothetical protein [Loigolactobacillus coryniformis]|uniref:hypothetical protein n=1 Tax=Loigolactobacillus coryniformis TaxID=1610 RepID=UPI0002194C4B|nr:hypothetical protein [Loigolactobacillus coryniformis]